jgi:fatty-acyl-CoA synthase
VIGFKDEKWGERPLALVVPKANHVPQVTKEDIFIFARSFSEKGVISKYAVPQSIWIVEAIEKTSVGKIDKKLLREKYT